MYISEVHDYSTAERDEKTQEFLTAGRKDAVKRVVSEIVDDEFNRLEEYADDFISDTAAKRAEAFLERVLKGDEDAAKSLLGATNSSRYRELGHDKGEPWARLIHGNLFTGDSIELRAKIVEAHAGLIRNERIKDLESIVDGLTQQIRKLEGELEATRERLR
jgi:F0F1-type ATP synthase delta subunit